MLILTLILACEPETVRQGSPDMSGYATVEDLEALQAQIEEQQLEIDTLSAAATATITVEADCSGSSSFRLGGRVRVLQVETCADFPDNDPPYLRCATTLDTYADSIPVTIQEYDEPLDDGASTVISVDCTDGLDFVRLTYLEL